MTATVLKFAPRRREAVLTDAPAVAATLAPVKPVFCFSAATLTAALRRFRTGFPGEVAFAVKSNASARVLETLARAGLEVWDVASVEEMQAVAAAGAVKPVFHYHNPVKSREEIRAAYQDHGCRRFAVDSGEELVKIAEELGADRSVSLAVRFVLPRVAESSAHDFSTKFGLAPKPAAALLKQVAALGFAPVLTFHPGSQCEDAEAYRRHIVVAAEIAAEAGVTLAALNVGGGFPARYVADAPARLETYFRVIRSAAEDSFGGTPPALECEPGRGLVATSTSLLTRVKLVRGENRDVFLNDGIYGALMEVYQAPSLRPPHRVIRDGAVVTGETRDLTIFGPTCDPLDQLPGSFALPVDLREGDYIEFGTLGAYGFATMTRFNGFGAHETVAVQKPLNL